MRKRQPAAGMQQRWPNPTTLVMAGLVAAILVFIAKCNSWMPGT
jgi:hypothetical protein